ncbi:MAG TPA: YdcF family protein [Burkholderiales bacterium]|nr:YdcF family protein [Burkholderiales bacterium]
MDPILVRTLSTCLLPPLNFLLLAAAGVVLSFRHRRLGLLLLFVGLGSLYACSAFGIAGALLGRFERVFAPPPLAELRRGEVIVVLGAGTYFAAPEYGEDTVSRFTLERLRWAARLHRVTGLPVLASGGRAFDTATPEAQQMAKALREDFQVRVRWLEERSRNTLESARNTGKLLAPLRVRRVLLVTHAAHMRRARLAFERAGLEVIAAPTGFTRPGPAGLLNYLPSTEGMLAARVLFHEVIGLGWYHLRLAAGAPDEDQR